MLLSNAFHALENRFKPLDASLEFHRREDVDIPAGQTSRQTHVLSTLADRQAQLIFIHDNSGSPELEAERNFRYLGRLQGVGNENLRGLVPSHDVDLFATQFVDDVLNSASTNADACADRIDFCIDGANGDLRAMARLARQRLNLDRPLADFRNFAFKQPPNEF